MTTRAHYELPRGWSVICDEDYQLENTGFVVPGFADTYFIRQNLVGLTALVLNEDGMAVMDPIVNLEEWEGASQLFYVAQLIEDCGHPNCDLVAEEMRARAWEMAKGELPKPAY